MTALPNTLPKKQIPSSKTRLFLSSVIVLIHAVTVWVAAQPPADPAPTESLVKWAEELQTDGLSAERRAELHGLQSAEALRRCRKYIDGWIPHFDPVTGLVPRNLGEGKNLWNGKDSGADNYSFMVLTSALTDRPLYEGRMLDILRTEEKVATQCDGLPADYNFTTKGHNKDKEALSTLIFHGSEYVKDGLMPITEWMGHTPWSARMLRIVDSILAQPTFDTPYGKIPTNNIEVNGEMMQVLSRLYFRTGKTEYLDMACRIADYYLLGDHHPTRHAGKLELRDHGCELISGLTEVYAACHFARKEKVATYRKPIHDMLDDILRVGVNEHGLMYRTVDLKTGKLIRETIHDNWGYNYNGFYTVYLLDKVERYRDAVRKALVNLKPHYWKYPWQDWGSDGIADSVEGAINLYNREPDVGGTAAWIDANINRMLDIQKQSGVIEGWHGDGNYARTAIMWVLWKQQGTTIQPWRFDTKLGAVLEGKELCIVMTTEQPWQGKLHFDQPRHKTIMKMPLDYPRINQFPEWYTVDAERTYSLRIGPETKTFSGQALIDGIPLTLKAGEKLTVQVASEPS